MNNYYNHPQSASLPPYNPYYQPNYHNHHNHHNHHDHHNHHSYYNHHPHYSLPPQLPPQSMRPLYYVQTQQPYIQRYNSTKQHQPHRRRTSRSSSAQKKKKTPNSPPVPIKKRVSSVIEWFFKTFCFCYADDTLYENNFTYDHQAKKSATTNNNKTDRSK